MHKKIFIKHDSTETGQALDYLINSSILIQTNDTFGNSTYSVHELFQQEIIESIPLNDFNEEFVASEIVSALNFLIKINSKFNKQTAGVIKQANCFLSADWPNKHKNKHFNELSEKMNAIKESEFFIPHQQVDTSVKSLIKNANLVADLSSVEMNPETFNLVCEEICRNRFIIDIIWKQNDLFIKCNTEKLSSIEKILEKNRDFHEHYPSDYVHGVLCNHVNETDKQDTSSTQINQSLPIVVSWLDTLPDPKIPRLETPYDGSKSNQENERIHANRLQIREQYNAEVKAFTEYLDNWKIEKINVHRGFKAILYRNDKEKQLVLAFRGIKLSAEDFTGNNKSQINVFVKSVMASYEIPDQIAYTFIHTEEAVGLSRQLSYSISFCGCSFGAWQAEHSVFFCHNNFDKTNVRAVSFNSPGSFESISKLRESNIRNMKKKLNINRLDIRTYLHKPDVFNTINIHLGKIWHFVKAK